MQISIPHRGDLFPHGGFGWTANFEALSWPQFTRQLAINKFIRQIFMQGFVNKSLFTYIKTHLSTVNGQLIFRRPGKVTSRACTEQIQVDRFRTESTLGLHHPPPPRPPAPLHRARPPGGRALGLKRQLSLGGRGVTPRRYKTRLGRVDLIWMTLGTIIYLTVGPSYL